MGAIFSIRTTGALMLRTTGAPTKTLADGSYFFDPYNWGPDAPYNWGPDAPYDWGPDQNIS